jgi:hypothetical protein
MTVLTIPAWRSDRYRTLAELLLVLGTFVRQTTWTLSVEEAAPDDAGRYLENWDPAHKVSTFELLHLVTPEVQVIDGFFRGTGPSNITIRAVDSTSWDIDTSDAELLDLLLETYDDAFIDDDAQP